MAGTADNRKRLNAAGDDQNGDQGLRLLRGGIVPVLECRRKEGSGQEDAAENKGRDQTRLQEFGTSHAGIVTENLPARRTFRRNLEAAIRPGTSGRRDHSIRIV